MTTQLTLNRQRISQQQLASTIQSEILAANETEIDTLVILIVCPVLKTVEDQDSPIFVFPLKDRKLALESIMPWAEKFQSVHLLLPALTLQYAVAYLPANHFDSLMEDPSLFGEDAVLITEKMNFWRNQ